MILIGLRYTVVLCHSFKGCALPPFLPVSCSFPEPHPGPQGCLYTLLELALGGKYCVISNPLILPSTGHTGDRGDAQLQSGGPRRSSRLDLPRDLVLERLSRLNLLGDPPVPGVPGGRHASTCLGTQFSGGRHASPCLGIRSLGGCHASACLGICTLTPGCLALQLQQY